LLIFAVLLGFLGIGLNLKPHELPSPLLDKPAPAFSLSVLDAPERVQGPQDLRGRVWLLSVWASWCSACREEQPAMLAFARTGAVPIYGLNYKDRSDDALRWLARFGNPYVSSFSDAGGLVGIDYGVYGVPETFVIDKQGVIRHKLVGPLTAETIRDTLLPLLKRLDS
jgi:cytochrome c biogenesis protein CcmG, thiol:disulfide interchange protein DsbE